MKPAQAAGLFAEFEFDVVDKFSLIEFDILLSQQDRVNIEAETLTKTGDFGDSKQLSLSLVRWLEPFLLSRYLGLSVKLNLSTRAFSLVLACTTTFGASVFLNPAGAEEPAKQKSTEKQVVVRAKGSGKNAKPPMRGTAPCLAWVNRDKPIQAVIVCVHGLGLHNGTYEPFGKRMADLGYAVYAIDVRGFGAWMENKGQERVDFDLCLNDVRTTLKVVRRAHPGVPVFLLGESMGGAIALRVTSLYPELVDGLISSVPSGDRFKQGKTSLKVALSYLSNKNKEINIGEGVVSQATQKEDVRKAWLEDPLARVKMSPKELLQFQNFMNGNHDCAKNIEKTSVLIVQGCQDKLVRPEGTVELFNHLSTTDRQIVLIPRAEHLIFEENQFTDQEIATVNSWITARLPKPVSVEASGEEKAEKTVEKPIEKSVDKPIDNDSNKETDKEAPKETQGTGDLK